jgi:uncharacterized protein YjcR
VRNIRKAYARGTSRATLAAKYGISESHMWKIVHRAAWKDVVLTDKER